MANPEQRRNSHPNSHYLIQSTMCSANLQIKPMVKRTAKWQILNSGGICIQTIIIQFRAHKPANGQKVNEVATGK